MVEAALHHRIRARLAVFFKQVFFQTAGVHANADRAVMVAGCPYDLFDPFFVADVARIDAQTGCPGFRRLDPPFVVKMNVRDDRYGDLRNDFFKGN